ncbi:MAG: lipoprotein-releasing system ATP-binding protein LolD [Candidatus Marinimicrobia bacterium]|nr:lipoprotein-releasing system ATP-binding protein LolD [Candidatus Neomarinimicrobiota bacterium]
MVIEAKNISKSYYNGDSDLTVLNNFSIKLNKNEIITITGQSGCGKSTALNILGTLDKPDSGDVIINGNYLNDYDDNQLSSLRNELIGFVFQFHHLLPDFTALENVLIPIWIKNVNQNDNYAMNLFDKLGIGSKINHYPSQLSGGEKSRVSLIRAIINKPIVLLADEPTGNLDKKNSKKLIDLLSKINQDYNQSIILTTHDQDVASLGNRQFLLENGSLIEMRENK